MLYQRSEPTPDPFRLAIWHAYRRDESECLKPLIAAATLSPTLKQQTHDLAKQLASTTRAYKKTAKTMDSFLHQYDLSTQEGIALMCLAEALMRIPDKATMDKFIADKIATANWQQHLTTDNTLFINAATWSLLFTGKVFAPTLHPHTSLLASLKNMLARFGISMLRPIILQSMKIIGKQFVLGETINDALQQSIPQIRQGYCYSYDMLGETARTEQDAEHYFNAYLQAIHAIGSTAQSNDPVSNPGISVKLSALHPRYEFAQRERVMTELLPRILLLAQAAKQYRLGLTIDAEEADRLDLMLDIFKQLYSDSTLDHWEGLGLAVQAYQKRAPYVIDWLIALAQTKQKRIMLRLVKGAYWDYEIKLAQVRGLDSYPVFTRKHATDVSYLACAKKMLAHRNVLYPQFGTHNAYCVAAIMVMAGDKQGFEFQCLHGMGAALYDQIVDKNSMALPCRIYAPVGTHKDLLGYLVRRLLENGANTSFINQLAEETTPIEKMIIDPVARIAALASKPHPNIPLPRYIYAEWLNAKGLDLSDPETLAALKIAMQTADKEKWAAAPIIAGKIMEHGAGRTVTAPQDHNYIVGHACDAREEDVALAFRTAAAAQIAWAAVPVIKRTAILMRAAELFEQHMPQLMTLITREGGRCIPDALSEVREAVDYCRYYAMRAHRDLVAKPLPGPTGEANQFSLHPRGVIAAISPWNFPLAIFTGQIVAALVAGNAVVAKPAEQTPLIAYEAVRLLHQAGIPKNVLQLVLGAGETIGAHMIIQPDLAGVVFTGSTEVARLIQKTLADRNGAILPLIAETGGQNAMIVDSTALPEQTVIDIIQSAFNSAGQRCSALRVLFVQADIADTVLTMLQGAMAELIIGPPESLATDIGPVIDQEALTRLQQHFAAMQQEARLHYQVPMRMHAAGTFFAPCVFELSDARLLNKEVFGPILHVIRYQAADLDQVIKAIADTGYGLTCGIQSRIDATVKYIADRVPVGNIYVNRNMIGAVVGAQPFGGEHLSGTGPKAGGPYYLPRFCVERSISVNTTAAGGNASLVSLGEES